MKKVQIIDCVVGFWTFQMFFFLILVFLTMEFQSFLNLEDSVSLFSSACCKVNKSSWLIQNHIDWGYHTWRFLISLTRVWKTSSTWLLWAAEVSRKGQWNFSAKSSPSSGLTLLWPVDDKSTLLATNTKGTFSCALTCKDKTVNKNFKVIEKVDLLWGSDFCILQLPWMNVYQWLNNKWWNLHHLSCIVLS